MNIDHAATPLTAAYRTMLRLMEQHQINRLSALIDQAPGTTWAARLKGAHDHGLYDGSALIIGRSPDARDSPEIVTGREEALEYFAAFDPATTRELPDTISRLEDEVESLQDALSDDEDDWERVPIDHLASQHIDHRVRALYTNGDRVTGVLRHLETVSSETYAMDEAGKPFAGTRIRIDVGGGTVSTAISSGDLVEVGDVAPSRRTDVF